MVEKRVCKHCKQEKALTEFRISTRCLSCLNNERRAKYRPKNPEKVRGHCTAILKAGPRMGEACGRGCIGDFCSAHKRARPARPRRARRAAPIEAPPPRELTFDELKELWRDFHHKSLADQAVMTTREYYDYRRAKRAWEMVSRNRGNAADYDRLWKPERDRGQDLEKEADRLKRDNKPEYKRLYDAVNALEDRMPRKAIARWTWDDVQK